MARLLGVKIERRDKRFTELLEIGRSTSGHSRLTTLTPEQDVAEIEIYLLRRGRDTSRPASEIRRLHRFTRRHTSRANHTRPLFEVTALRRSRRKFEIQLHEDGKLQETATVRIPGSRGAVAALLLLLLALIGLGIGGYAFLNPGETEARPAAAAQSSDTERNRDTGEDTQRNADTDNEVATDPPAEDPAHDDAAIHEGAAIVDSVADPAPQAPPTEATEPDVHTATVYFLPDSVQLTRDAARTLSTFLGRIEGAEILAVRVEGHTALYGNEAGRERISRGRIDAVLSYLERSGWSPAPSPEKEAFGADAPVTRATDQQQLNRRAEIHVTYRRDER